MSNRDEVKSIIGDYKYGFKTNAATVASTGKGLTLDVVKEISRLKGEPDWMLEYRIKAYLDRFLILAQIYHSSITMIIHITLNHQKM